MIAPAKPPLAAPTITASEVAINNALPRPQPARNPITPLTPPASPAAAENAILINSPMIRVFFAPMRLHTHPVTNIASELTNSHLVHSSDTCDGDAGSCSVMLGRIGSTRPIPMNETTQAKATAQTDLGCCNSADLLSDVPAAVSSGSCAVVLLTSCCLLLSQCDSAGLLLFLPSDSVAAVTTSGRCQRAVREVRPWCGGRPAPWGRRRHRSRG